MPQETNLNVSPYFDDFDSNKDYYKVLFKPGYPIQARELNTLQSIAQYQTEQFGKHIFKEGSVVIPGNLKYDNPVYAVEIESSFNGVPISVYFEELNGKKIRGQSSNVVAEIFFTLTDIESERKNFTLYVKFLESGGENFDIRTFFDSETLILEEPLLFGNSTIQSGQGFCNTISSNSISQGSYVSLSPGVYFVRGIFARVEAQNLLLDQYGILPSYKVGFQIEEKIVNSFEDNSLYDNAQGFSNYSAPGADRFQLSLILSKKLLTDSEINNFVEIFRVENGVPTYITSENSQYSIIRDELARRTYDESGNYIVNPFTVFVRECLNDRYTINGLYYSNQVTSNGNIPSEDNIIYQIGPGKAYVNGYDVESISSRLLEVPKPRTTATINDVSINFNAGTLFVLNNSHGAAPIGLGTTNIVSLMDSRLGSDPLVASGTTIGQARVYDYIPESSYQDDTSRMHLRLFNIDTYTIIGISTSITLTTPTHIKGKTSNATGFLKNSVNNSTSLTLYSVSGQFLDNERIIINGIESNRLISTVKDYSINDVKSVYSKVGITTFNCDLSLSNKFALAPGGTTFNVSGLSGGISTVSSGLNINFINTLKSGDIISYNNAGGSVPIFNRVNSIGAAGTFFTIQELTTVPNICVGSISTTSFTVNNIIKITPEIIGRDVGLVTLLPSLNIENIELETTSIFQRRKFKNVSFSNYVLSLSLTEENIFFASFDEDRYLISYEDGTVEKIRFDKFTLDTQGKLVTFVDLSKQSGTCEVIATVQNLKPNSKIKKLNKISSITVDKSSQISSGIGTTTLNDGLTYSQIYGLRVQDEQISLNVPDVVKILGIYESSTTSNPQIPKIKLYSFTGPTNSSLDYNIGEIITGSKSGAVGIIVSNSNSDELEFCYLNSFQFLDGELVSGSETSTTAIILQSYVSDKNILNNYFLNNGQTFQIYDYSRLVRKANIAVPKRKLKIIFQNYTIDSNDEGEFVTVNSYPKDSYKNDIPSLENIRCSDLIDIRPRVKPYDISSNRSPFENESKNLLSEGVNSNYNIIPDNNIILSYNFYLGRIDNVILNKDGTFEVVQGIPNLSPVAPKPKQNSLTLASVYLSPYIFNILDANVVMKKHRRYRMSDISLLEDRILRLEEYTTLSLSEMKTESFIIKDSETGFDRFKCGFFVDNFTVNEVSDQQNLQFNCEVGNGFCSPVRSSTFIPLQLGSEAIQGLTSTFNSTVDQSFVTDLGSPGIKKTGDLITLDYVEEEYLAQDEATKSDDIGESNFWRGHLTLTPSSDTWYEERIVENTSFNTNITSTTVQNKVIVGDPVNTYATVYIEPPTYNPPTYNPPSSSTPLPYRPGTPSSNPIRPAYLTGGLITLQYGGNVAKAIADAQAAGQKIIIGQGAVDKYNVDPKLGTVVPPATRNHTSVTQNPFGRY
jgi:hypothetical protein